ncbi:MAG TPA: hypothetical protein VFW22_16460 [Pseudolabrys sp.]|nr:hypothetical protein [Pseudolabrys sp.]
MIAIAPYVPGDEAALKIQAAQLQQPSHPIAILSERGYAWTARSAGQVLGIGGFVVNHVDYVTAWASFADGKGTAMIPIARAMAREIAAAANHYARVDLIVVADFQPGHFLALALGMTPEATLRHAGENGEDMVLWTKIGPHRDSAIEGE